MSGKIFLAAGLMGMSWAVLSPTPSQAISGSGAFAPAADNSVVLVADLYAVPPRRRYSHSRRPARRYYEPAEYSVSRQERYVAYDCCAAYPAYDPSHTYSPLGRYYYEDGRAFHLRGFNGSPASYYYW